MYIHRAECKVYGEEDVDIAQPAEMTVRSAPPKEVYQRLFLRKMR